MPIQHQSDSSFSNQMKEDTFVSDESIQEFQEDLREAEKERIQSSQRRKVLLDDLRSSFQNKDLLAAKSEEKKEKERLLLVGSVEDIENIFIQLKRDIQTLKSKQLLSNSSLKLYKAFHSLIQISQEKRKQYQTLHQKFLGSQSKKENTQNSLSPIKSKESELLQQYTNEITKISSDTIAIYQHLDTQLYSDLESEAYAKHLFYSSIMLLSDQHRHKLIKLCTSKCQNAGMEQRIALYKKLVEQLAVQNNRIAAYVHQSARSKAREYAKSNHVKLAVKELCFAIMVNKDDALTYKMLYNLFVKENDTQKAFTALRQLLRLNPNDNKLRKKVAVQWYQQGNIQNAIEEYKTLIEQDDVDIETWKEFGKLYFENHKFSDVPSALQPYLDQFPHDIEAKTWLAIAFMNCELFSNAIQHFESLLEESPDDIEDDIEIVKHLVYSYRKINLHQKAIDLLTSQIKNHPQPYVVQLLLGAVYQENGDWEKADEVYELLLQSGIQSSSVLLAAAHVKQFFHKEEEAQKYLEQAMKLDPNRWNVYLKIGILHRNCLRWEEAETAFNQADKLSNGNPLVTQERMLLYSITGDWEKASETMNHIVNE